MAQLTLDKRVLIAGHILAVYYALCHTARVMSSVAAYIPLLRD